MFPEPLVGPDDLAKLDVTGSLAKLQYVFDAITLTRHKLEGKVPLLGFTGAPVNYYYSEYCIRCSSNSLIKTILYIL